MAGKKLVRDLFLSRQPLFLHLTSQQGSRTRLRLPSTLPNGKNMGYRGFGVFSEFSKKVKGEVTRSQEFQQSVKELKDKAEELKGVKEDLRIRTKETTEQLYKHVDGAWTEAEATAKKVSANVKEKISAAKEEVKETLNIGKQESSGSTKSSDKDGADVKDDKKSSSGEETDEQTGSSDNAESFFGKFKSSTPSSKLSSAFQKLKEAKVTDFVKKGYDVVKDELYGNPSKRKHLEYTPPPSFKGETSTRTDIVVLPSKQSRWNKKWEAFREKMQGHPLFKRFAGISEPVVTKSQEIAEDMRERWETSDNPIVHKIQDVSDTIFQETDAAASFKEIRRRDPSFSLMDFVAEVQEAVRPVLNAYIKGDLETLKKYCTSEVITRCEAEHKAFQSHGIFFDNKILHISEVEVRETKMMGTSPIIIVAFQTQQVHCVRDRDGAITEGGQDTIHTVYYAWAMQQVEPEELGGGAIYPIWKLREMQQLGIQALI
ncbi:mitochondrial import inner membrane translocase subunit tim44, putative [Ricinus communis]|uniref:Mitochondrial import inner membrane translocase subunit tim44, putative n=1 Tax=Ricinus communis TaxID=3988 RepID=B9SF39_RICCO|nr:mitochondrial import inner membrane translocase subunit tim44, putative [Ricinus communis]|eukprot:XP_002524608.1 mitochondrial import inner membrane translocase subunit TIM44-2 [Ricinus communis]